MPTYEYQCQQCHERVEAVQKFTDAALERVSALRAATPQGLLGRRHRLQGQRVLQERQSQVLLRVFGQVRVTGEGRDGFGPVVIDERSDARVNLSGTAPSTSSSTTSSSD